MRLLFPSVLAVLLAVFVVGCGGGGPVSLQPSEVVTIPAASTVMTGTGTAPARTLSTSAITVTSGQSISLPVFVDDAKGLAGATLTPNTEGNEFGLMEPAVGNDHKTPELTASPLMHVVHFDILADDVQRRCGPR